MNRSSNLSKEIVSEQFDRLKSMIAKMVLNYNYWGYLFSRIGLQVSNQPDLILALAVERDSKIYLKFNPYLTSQINDEDLKLLVEHEGLHLLNKHLQRMINVLHDYNNPQDENLFNIASDIVVNDILRIDSVKLAGDRVNLYTSKTFKFPRNKSTEWYFVELRKNRQDANESDKGGEGKSDFSKQNGSQQSNNQNQQQTPDKQEGPGCGGKKGGDQGEPQFLSPHNNWIPSNIEDKLGFSRKVEKQVRRIVKESIKSFSKERGTLPGHIKELVSEILGQPQLPYYQIIRKLVLGTRLAKPEISYSNINKKRTYSSYLEEEGLPEICPFPGTKIAHTFKIVILLDTSGSMSLEQIHEGLSGLRNIIENDRHCHTTVLEVDTKIHKEYVCKRISDIDFHVKGRGGTRLSPGLFRAKELNCDICLAFTDGYTEKINNLPRRKLPKNILWVLTKGGSKANIEGTGPIVMVPEK